ncbi:nucleoside hydrolase [Canibacter sp. lx-72]|uniref:nucleoside hydrolase n=1 Tax=Canibacter zhuwentaonis TaxID=2837491 RepID=UPI001BDCB2B9|nr:nucleoside hydrolase [Canibacter zhuwentaonis]MBT1018551.1 nucleoside hydrolase [Canibacter zhuwentaonis]
MAKPVIIDTDPGIDDAVAIMLAVASCELDVRAITTVAGNVGIDITTSNALGLRDLLGLQCPVAAGAWRTLNRNLAVTAAEVHGAGGLGNWHPEIPDITGRSELIALPLMSQVLREVAESGELATIVALGPLTNVAQLLVADAAARELIKELVIMGGGYGTRLGNITPAAEFNIYTDPEAAALVFNSGVPVRMVGLNVTETTTLGLRHLPRVTAAGGIIAEGLRKMLPAYQDTPDIAGETAQHDALTMSALVDSEILEFVPARVLVEVTGEHTRGMTLVDRKSADPNAQVAIAADVERFRSLLNERLGALAERVHG